MHLERFGDQIANLVGLSGQRCQSRYDPNHWNDGPVAWVSSGDWSLLIDGGELELSYVHLVLRPGKWSSSQISSDVFDTWIPRTNAMAELCAKMFHETISWPWPFLLKRERRAVIMQYIFETLERREGAGILHVLQHTAFKKELCRWALEKGLDHLIPQAILAGVEFL